MDLQTFKNSLANPEPPPGLTPALAALWWDAKGDWETAHQRAQERDDAAGAHVHAYLHRKEGDQPNANYWYRRAGTNPVDPDARRRVGGTGAEVSGAGVTLPISPLVGEMAGRPEGGAVPPTLQNLASSPPRSGGEVPSAARR